jgi:hypothetical protein
MHGDWLDAHPVQFNTMDKGFYTFDDLLMRKVREQLIAP